MAQHGRWPPKEMVLPMGGAALAHRLHNGAPEDLAALVLLGGNGAWWGKHMNVLVVLVFVWFFSITFKCCFGGFVCFFRVFVVLLVLSSGLDRGFYWFLSQLLSGYCNLPVNQIDFDDR